MNATLAQIAGGPRLCAAAARSQLSAGGVRSADSRGCRAQLVTCALHVPAFRHFIPPPQSTNANKHLSSSPMVLGERFGSPPGASSAPVGAMGEQPGLRTFRLSETVTKLSVWLFDSLALAACVGDPAELIYNVDTFWTQKCQ